MPCGCMVFALSIYNYSRALRTDSLLLIISSSGMSSTSTSLCPFGLKCCGTASSVLCSMTLRCSPNLSRNACFVYPKYSAGVLGMFSHWRHCIMQMRFLDPQVIIYFLCIIGYDILKLYIFFSLF